MKSCTVARIRAAMAFALPALLASLAAAVPALAQVVPDLDERITFPRNHIAYDHGVGWNDAIHTDIRFDIIPGVTDGNEFTTCAGVGVHKVWHTQSVARLPNKDGRAYFAVAQSWLRGGYVSVLQTAENGYDPDTELLKPIPGGRYIWQDLYGAGNPHGEANHPGKIEVVGGLMIVALQDWRTILMASCNVASILAGSEPGNDGVAFYDVRDPEHPKFLGRIRASEVGIDPSHVGDSGDVFPFTSRQVESVSLWRSPDDEWFLTFGGQGKVNGGVLLQAGPDGVRPSSGVNYTKLGTGVYGTSGAYGGNFDSYELLRTPGDRGREGTEHVLAAPAGRDGRRQPAVRVHLARQARVRRLRRSAGVVLHLQLRRRRQAGLAHRRLRADGPGGQQQSLGDRVGLRDPQGHADHLRDAQRQRGRSERLAAAGAHRAEPQAAAGAASVSLGHELQRSRQGLAAQRHRLRRQDQVRLATAAATRSSSPPGRSSSTSTTSRSTAPLRAVASPGHGGITISGEATRASWRSSPAATRRRRTRQALQSDDRQRQDAGTTAAAPASGTAAC